MAKFDYVIIGSGLGGLECAYTLSKEGFSVCVLEKNRQFGGSLQIFVRDKAIFDTGVHYLGGLDEGQNLNQFFKYFDIMDKLNLHKMDEDGFDKISFDNDPNVYNHAQGYENFIDKLSIQFPGERTAIERYAKKIKEVCDYFPMYRLREANEDGGLGVKYLDVNAKDFIASLTSNRKLQMVLAGSNPLYAGDGDKTPLYVHALVVNTYIESSYKCIDGGSQIERYLTKNVRSQGGVVRNYAEVKEIVEVDGKIKYVQLADGEKIEGGGFISNIHPTNTMRMLSSKRIKKAFRNRIDNLKNSASAFVLDVVLKPDSFKYKNYNYYHFSRENVWDSVRMKGAMWPDSYCVFVPRSSKPTEYADSLTVLSYMQMDELEEWKDTYSTIPKARESRGQSYEDFKLERGEKLLNMVCKRIPELKNCVKSFTVGTPLTYRDYIGVDDGSLYGIAKDYKEPLKTFISPTTKIPNLYFTGQNLNMHGILGVTVGAVRTCEAILGQDYLIKKINKC